MEFGIKIISFSFDTPSSYTKVYIVKDNLKFFIKVENVFSWCFGDQNEDHLEI